MKDGWIVGVFSIGLSIVGISPWVVAGFLTWDWIDPESFWGVVLFIVVWLVTAELIKLIISYVVIPSACLLVAFIYYLIKK